MATKLPRCPTGTQRNKKSGNCESKKAAASLKVNKRVSKKLKNKITKKNASQKKSKRMEEQIIDEMKFFDAVEEAPKPPSVKVVSNPPSVKVVSNPPSVKVVSNPPSVKVVSNPPSVKEVVKGIKPKRQLKAAKPKPVIEKQSFEPDELEPDGTSKLYNFVKSHNKTIKWDYFRLSRNLNITIQDVLNHRSTLWDWDGLSENPNISLNDMFNNPNKPWDFKFKAATKVKNFKEEVLNRMEFWRESAFALSSNLNITMDDIRLGIKYGWRWRYDQLSKNPNVTVDFVEKTIENNNPYLNGYWQFNELSKNPNITIDFVKKYYKKKSNEVDELDLSKNSHEYFNFNYLTNNSAISLQDMMDNPQLPWCKIALAKKPNVDFEFVATQLEEPNNAFQNKMIYESYLYNNNFTLNDVLNNSTKPWNMELITIHSKITLDDIYDHFDELKWDFYHLQKNPNATFQDVFHHKLSKKMAENGKGWSGMVRSEWSNSLFNRWSKIKMQDVLEHPELPWEYALLSENSAITMQDVEENPDKPWNFEYLSRNPNLRIKYIEKWYKKHRLNYNGISENPMGKGLPSYKIGRNEPNKPMYLTVMH